MTKAPSGEPRGRKGTVLEQHKAPSIGQVADAAERPPVAIDLDLDPDAIGPDNRRNHVPVGTAAGLRNSTEGMEIGRFVVLDERMTVDLHDGPIAWLFDDGLAVRIHALLALARKWRAIRSF